MTQAQIRNLRERGIDLTPEAREWIGAFPNNIRMWAPAAEETFYARETASPPTPPLYLSS